VQTKANFVLTSIVALLAAIFVPTSAANADEEIPCVSTGYYQLSDVESGLTVCPEAEVLVFIPLLDEFLMLPSRGVSQSVVFDSQAGLGLEEVSLIVNDVGIVRIFLDEQVFGGGQQNYATQTSSPASALTTYPGCGTSSYSLLGYYWNSTWLWRYNSSNQFDSSSLSALQSSFNLWSTGANRCTGALYSSSFSNSYLGATSLSPAVTSSGTCGTANNSSTVGWGALPNNRIAVTCTWFYNSVASESDMKFNSSLLFYTGSSTAGCTGSRYDLRELATHEAGHVIGLGHSIGVDNQIMKPTFGYCETNQRLLAPGDIYGLGVLY
jgi:hypothetical protein